MALFRRGFVIWVIVGWLLASGSCDDDEFHRAFPIVEPDSAHTKLRLAREGLEAIQRITTPIAVVGVIGPYRSGKSFLLNQLLSLPCDKGFGVGHMRDTKTKGIWAWGIPVEMPIDGLKVSVLYIDTEGFESVGKSNVYDDRIFALATIMSSVLIYNLPETIREADISRLSFAVEIAEEFYSRVKGQDVAFQPAKLLWLIQRDFLRKFRSLLSEERSKVRVKSTVPFSEPFTVDPSNPPPQKDYNVYFKTIKEGITGKAALDEKPVPV